MPYVPRDAASAFSHGGNRCGFRSLSGGVSVHAVRSSNGHASHGTNALLSASFVAQLCALGRYTTLARLLGPEQLGIAVAIAEI